MSRPHYRLRQRIAAKKKNRKKKAQGDRQPGQASAALARRMGNALTEIFDKYGPEIYASIVISLKDGLKDHLQRGIDDVESEVTAELGRRGVEEAQQHFRAWMNEFVEDLIHHGMDEASVTIEELADSLVAEFAEGEGGDEPGAELFDVEGVEVVEEEDVEPVDVPEEGDEVDEALEVDEEEVEPIDLDALEIEPTE